MFKEMTSSEIEAPGKVISEEVKPMDPYTIAESDYIGHRPGPILSRILGWDDRAEHFGPLMSRLLQLSKDMVEETDVIQSLILMEMGMEENLIHTEEK